MEQTPFPACVTETATNTETAITYTESCKATVVEHQNTTPEIDNTGAISTNAKLYENINKNSEDFDEMKQHQPIHENNEEAQKGTTASTEISMQEPNTSNSSLAEIKPCFGSGSGNIEDEKKKGYQQKQHGKEQSYLVVLE